MGVPIEHPKIQRECYGRWTVDLDSLVFKYSEEKNHYETVPEFQKMETVIGVDVGFDDSDAITVLGWGTNDKRCYLLEEHIRSKQGITELAEQIEVLIKKYDPLRIVMDTGGLGKKISEEIRKRYSLPIVAAEKSRKFEFIELLNDAMRTKRFFAKKTSQFAQDCLLVEWDYDKTTPEKKVISDGFHSDACDSTLYAYREALHWLTDPAPVKIVPNTPEWFKRQEEDAIRILEQRLEQEKADKMMNEMGWE